MKKLKEIIKRMFQKKPKGEILEYPTGLKIARTIVPQEFLEKVNGNWDKHLYNNIQYID